MSKKIKSLDRSMRDMYRKKIVRRHAVAKAALSAAVHLVRDLGIPPSHAAAQTGISLSTLHEHFRKLRAAGKIL